MSEQANADLIRNLYAAFRRGDIPQVMSFLDPRADLNFEGPATIPWTGARHGHEGWVSFFQTIGESLEDITLSMELFAAQGDNVAAAGRYQGRVRKTGNHIDSPLVHLWTIRNGLVVHCQEMTNTAAEAAACS